MTVTAQQKPATITTTTSQADPHARLDARQAIMALVSVAVAEMHPAARAAKPEWFEHLLHRAETKAAKIAAQAALSPYACGDATFAEVFAKTLPTLFTEALDRLDNPEPD